MQVCSVLQEIQYGPVERFGLFGRDEMVSRQDDEFRFRDTAGDEPRMVVPDHLLRSLDDQRLSADRRELFRCHVRFVDHEAQDLRVFLRPHYKLHYISQYEGRSANGEVIYLIRKAIEDFEKQHGKIEMP